jgi:hypothetical protein
LENVTVDVAKPPNIYGIAKFLDKTDNRSLSMEYSAGKSNAIIPLSGNIRVGEAIQVEEANVNYRLLDNSFGLQYFSNVKSESDLYAGWGVGFQKFPYVFGTIGVNKEYFEIGVAILLGYSSSEKISYDGYSVDEEGKMLEDPYFSEEKYRCSLYSGAYLYTSFYFKRFALNYAASASYPTDNYIYRENGCFNAFPEEIFFFDFPALLMQDIGIAYTNNHIRYRVGLNQITGVKFPGQYYRGTVHTAWLF